MSRGYSLLRIAVAVVATYLGASPVIFAETGPIEFGGVPVRPGGTVRADVPLSAQEREYASEGGNTPPAQAVAVLAVPPGFDPHKSWPVLVVFATDDFKHLNRDDLMNIYRTDALASGWVVLAGDGPQYPSRGTSGWRAGMTLAAIEALYRSFPGSSHWPMATAGYSGGAKQAGQLTPLLSLAGCQLIGIYLTGINVDRLTAGYQALKPGREFLHTPVFISAGQDDKVAPAFSQMAVNLSLKKNGFDRVRFETFQGGHVVKRSHLREALQWFRELASHP